ncbi:MAG: DUF1934 domain-containing protein [Vampirovibrionales bacterium]
MDPVSDLKLKRSVYIDVCHTQSLNGMDPVEIEEDVEGALYQVDPQTYILAFDSDLNGRKVTTTVKVGQDTVSLVKIGDVHSRQTFAVDQWLASQFFYGGGSIVPQLHQEIRLRANPDGGLIEVLYELWSGDTHLGYFNLELFIR